MERTFKIPDVDNSHCDYGCEFHKDYGSRQFCILDLAQEHLARMIKPGPSCPVGKTVKLTLEVIDG
jgi:hypothetical protein